MFELFIYNSNIGLMNTVYSQGNLMWINGDKKEYTVENQIQLLLKSFSNSTLHWRHACKWFN